ncbi:hypothetical protein Chor_008217, partial [Crotalus horridus]
QTCVDIKDNIVDEGYNFTPKGERPLLKLHMSQWRAGDVRGGLVRATPGLSALPKGSQGMLQIYLFRSWRRRERIESLIGANLHHFNLGRRMPGFDYGPDGFGTGLTPLHLSDDGEGGAFHFHDPPPPYTAYKYPDIQHPDDPPPPYEASISPDNILCSPPDGVHSQMGANTQLSLGNADTSLPLPDEPVPPSLGPSPLELENSADSSTLLVLPDTPLSESTLSESLGGNRHSHCSQNTMV